jgi:hypothetical protein
MRHQLAVHLALADAAGYQQVVLGAEIKDDDGLALGAGNGFFGSRRLLAADFLGNLQVG